MGIQEMEINPIFSFVSIISLYYMYNGTEKAKRI